MGSPRRGEVWLVELSPTEGREQANRRPVLVVSEDRFNLGKADLVIAIPITSKEKGIPTHIRIDPPEGGLSVPSFVMCEAIRSIWKGPTRFIQADAWGTVSSDTLDKVETTLRYLLGFS